MGMGWIYLFMFLTLPIASFIGLYVGKQRFDNSDKIKQFDIIKEHIDAAQIIVAEKRMKKITNFKEMITQKSGKL